MFNSHSLFTPLNSYTSLTASEVFWNTDKQSNENLYQQIVYRVLRKPKHLINHLQRIYFTYTEKMPDQLYAALIDLLWVLEDRGVPLSNRMILSTRSLLTEQQKSLFANYLKRPNRSLLQGNKFSVFTTGQLGKSVLVTEQHKVTKEHDPLAIALDYIEYSQLDEAIKTLELAVIKSTERQDLQNQLLELYKVTQDNKAFTKMHDALKKEEINLSDNWQNLADYFSGNSR